jgi:hypothetical protein
MCELNKVAAAVFVLAAARKYRRTSFDEMVKERGSQFFLKSGKEPTIFLFLRLWGYIVRFGANSI